MDGPDSRACPNVEDPHAIGIDRRQKEAIVKQPEVHVVDHVQAVLFLLIIWKVVASRLVAVVTAAVLPFVFQYVGHQRCAGNGSLAAIGGISVVPVYLDCGCIANLARHFAQKNEELESETPVIRSKSEIYRPDLRTRVALMPTLGLGTLSWKCASVSLQNMEDVSRVPTFRYRTGPPRSRGPGLGEGRGGESSCAFRLYRVHQVSVLAVDPLEVSGKDLVKNR